MAKRMLIDATHPEETRVVVLNGNRLEELDFETSTKQQVKGNIYLAKVTRVEPSLQAGFVDYGGNRHGFLAFSEIHPDYYRIPVGDRDATDDESVGGVSGVREALSEEAGVPLADALPEPVAVAAPPQGGEDEASDVEPSDPSAPRLVPEPPNSPPEASDQDHAPRLTGLPWDDLAPGRDTMPLESTVASRPAAPGAATAESNLVSFDEPAASAFWEHPEIVYETQSDITKDTGGELSDAGDWRADGEGGDREGETIETLDGDEFEEAESQRSRTFRHYKIQEVIKRRQIMLVQVAKEERGTKGAALTTYLSLAGRYCVLMPNTARGGGVSRKITSVTDRRRLKDVLEELDIPEGMGVIVRTAGAERSKAEIKRDYEYLLRLWNEIRDLTLQSTAPALIYEEGNLIKRSIRDLYTRDTDEVLVEGEEGYRTAKAFMKMLMPSHARRVQPYRDAEIGLLHRFQVEGQIDAVHSPIVQLRSGGYVVINQAEALVAIDVNSGRSTRDRNIEETAVRTNLEAAEEIARQLRLRDLAGLIVIDFIDMEEHRNQGAVERKLKEALKNDRARIQVGRISAFGLLEMSRQRLRPSLVETSTQPCPHCGGTGFIRSTESTALYVLRSIEEEGMRRRSAEICVYVPTAVALYILNQKRDSLVQLETRYGMRVMVARDDALVPPAFRLERLRAYGPAEAVSPTPPLTQAPHIEQALHIEEEEIEHEVAQGAETAESDQPEQEGEDEPGRSRRRRRRRRRREDEPAFAVAALPEVVEGAAELAAGSTPVDGRTNGQSGSSEEDEGEEGRRRRRGRRGGRRRGRREGDLDPIFAEPRPPSDIVEILPLSAMEGQASAPVAELAGGAGEINGLEFIPESPPAAPIEVETSKETPDVIIEAAEPHLYPIDSAARAELADFGEREILSPGETGQTSQVGISAVAPAVEPERPIETVNERPSPTRRGWWQWVRPAKPEHER
jgi:ribonuclease E